MWVGPSKNKLSPKILVCPSAESVSSRHSLTFKSDPQLKICSQNKSCKVEGIEGLKK